MKFLSMFSHFKWDHFKSYFSNKALTNVQLPLLGRWNIRTKFTGLPGKMHKAYELMFFKMLLSGNKRQCFLRDEG